MCFHSKQSKKAQTIEKRFNAKFENAKLFQPTDHYNGFEYPKTPIITNENSNIIQMVEWGLVPSWAETDWKRNYTLNARIETLDEKPSFKNIQQNRCIILVDGFYEWKKEGNKKYKYEIGVKNELFAFAGLFDVNKGKKSYTIITTEAKGIMREIHNTKLRMPVSLTNAEDYNNWLNGNEINPFFNFSVNPLENNKQRSLF